MTDTLQVICIHNQEYVASLEMGKRYRALPDAPATARGLIRVVDESGEDYLYPAEWFEPAHPRINQGQIHDNHR